MREDFVEPLPDLKTNATLVFGKVRVKCFVVDVTVDEFCVAIPGAERYEGDPRLMLITGDAIYPVHLILQEAHAGGFSYRLRRLPTDGRSTCRGFLKNFYIHHTSVKCIAAGLALSAIASFWFLSSEKDSLQLLCLGSIRRDTSGWWPPSIQHNDKVPPGISTDKSLVVKKDARLKNRNVREIAPVEEPETELRTVSVSLISPASMSAPSLLPQEDSRVEKTNSGKPVESTFSNQSFKKKAVSLTNLLEDGQVGRLRTLTPDLIPWLYGNASAKELGYFRISDAACKDLQQFELGLRGLPIETCMDAIESLKRSLRRSNNINNARTVHGFDDVFVVKSDDADVFFRARKGMVEIVRVLPSDYKAE